MQREAAGYSIFFVGVTPIRFDEWPITLESASPFYSDATPHEEPVSFFAAFTRQIEPAATGGG
jgi:hypothetical protein